ncbi:LUD domain-containing protein [Halovenus rubra]|uniref:LUD domain-containing protein n=2 Tax=Halovenus rubra TaxID=869890 RepID=A0ABD5X3S4_9EURY|nr:LUD domain-containing protein [Halovenus rubra]
MTQDTPTTTYEQFASVASEYGIEPRRVEPNGVAEAVTEMLDPPAVGTQLPWEDATLPDGVTTEPTPADLRAATTGVTAASLAIAEYGSIVLDADEDGSDSVSLFNDLHVAVLHEDDIVPDMATAFEQFGERLRETRESAIIATGPSATADMGALVNGAHGPKQVEVIVVS